jgi:hypothetical protein
VRDVSARQCCVATSPLSRFSRMYWRVGGGGVAYFWQPFLLEVFYLCGRMIGDGYSLDVQGDRW